MNALQFASLMAVTLPVVGLVGIWQLWRRWQATTAAKVVIALGIMFLLVPGTCYGLTTLGEYAHVFKAMHFQ